MVRLSVGDRLLLIAVLAAFGAVDAGYLVYEWYAPSGWCDLNDVFSCSKVRESVWSAVAGIPTATVGLVGFSVLLALAVLALRGTERIGPWTTFRWLLVFAIIGAGVGFGLTLVEIFAIHAVCILCALGFGLDLAVLGLAVTLPREVQSASRSE